MPRMIRAGASSSSAAGSWLLILVRGPRSATGTGSGISWTVATNPLLSRSRATASSPLNHRPSYRITRSVPLHAPVQKHFRRLLVWNRTQKPELRKQILFEQLPFDNRHGRLPARDARTERHKEFVDTTSLKESPIQPRPPLEKQEPNPVGRAKPLQKLADKPRTRGHGFN